MLKALKKDKTLKILIKENISEKEHLNTDAAEHTHTHKIMQTFLCQSI